MRAFRLCRSMHPPYSAEGARRVGGRWNSKGTPVLYMSENRSLAVLEVLVHLTAVLPDKYVLGSAFIPDDVPIETIRDGDVPPDWATLDPAAQRNTRRIGDEWIARGRTAVLSVPSVISGERNWVLHPSHPDSERIQFGDVVPFQIDVRLLRTTTI